MYKILRRSLTHFLRDALPELSNRVYSSSRDKKLNSIDKPFIVVQPTFKTNEISEFEDTKILTIQANS